MPNITVVADNRGNMFAHKAGCRDIRHEQEFEAYHVEASTELEVVADIWQDQIEESGDSVESYRRYMQFSRCTRDLLSK